MFSPWGAASDHDWLDATGNSDVLDPVRAARVRHDYVAGLPMVRAHAPWPPNEHPEERER